MFGKHTTVFIQRNANETFRLLEYILIILVIFLKSSRPYLGKTFKFVPLILINRYDKHLCFSMQSSLFSLLQELCKSVQMIVYYCGNQKVCLQHLITFPSCVLLLQLVALKKILISLQNEVQYVHDVATVSVLVKKSPDFSLLCMKQPESCMKGIVVAQEGKHG